MNLWTRDEFSANRKCAPRVFIKGIDYKWANEISLGVKLTLQIADICFFSRFWNGENINLWRFEECEKFPQAHVDALNLGAMEKQKQCGYSCQTIALANTCISLRRIIEWHTDVGQYVNCVRCNHSLAVIHPFLNCLSCYSLKSSFVQKIKIIVTATTVSLFLGLKNLTIKCHKHI